jgi:hypothetical protein
MEVHHHGHVHSRSKWKEYLFQFFMLFLAVFCGFLAEYRLEQIIERHREHDYAKSMMNDLRSDTTRLARNIRIFNVYTKRQDSLMAEFDLIRRGFHTRFFKLSTGSIAGFPDFIHTDGTIEQLKNSGGFRLIRDRKVVDSILAYDAEVKRLLINEKVLGEELMKIIDLEKLVFNYEKIDQELKKSNPVDMEKAGFNALATNDEQILSRYYNQIRYYNTLSQIIILNAETIKSAGVRLLKLMQEEYD